LSKDEWLSSIMVRCFQNAKLKIYPCSTTFGIDPFCLHSVA
jgi:hypothetical protein